MTVACRNPLGNERLVAFEVNKAHRGMAGAGQNVAIAALERRACDDTMSAFPAQIVDPSCDRLKPGLAIGIGQRRPLLHFLDIGFGVKPIAVLEAPAEFLSQQSGDRRLSGTRDTHDDQRDDVFQLAFERLRGGATHPSSPAAARSARKVRSPSGCRRAAGTSADCVRTFCNMSRFALPETRHAMWRLLSIGG